MQILSKMKKKLCEKDIQIKRFKDKEQAMFICKDHPTKEIEFYCSSNNQFLCYLCSFERGISKQTAKVCSSENIMSNSKSLIEKLKQVKKEINNSIEQISEIAEQKM